MVTPKKVKKKVVVRKKAAPKKVKKKVVVRKKIVKKPPVKKKVVVSKLSAKKAQVKLKLSAKKLAAKKAVANKAAAKKAVANKFAANRASNKAVANKAAANRSAARKLAAKKAAANKAVEAKRAAAKKALANKEARRKKFRNEGLAKEAAKRSANKPAIESKFRKDKVRLKAGIATDKQKKDIAFKKKVAQRAKDYGPRLKEPFKNNNFNIKSDSITNRYQIGGKARAKDFKELKQKVKYRDKAYKELKGNPNASTFDLRMDKKKDRLVSDYVGKRGSQLREEDKNKSIAKKKRIRNLSKKIKISQKKK